MKKIQNFLLLSLFCLSFAFISKKTKNSSMETGKVWVGITYKMAKDGASAERTAAIGAYGVIHAAVEGAAWGAVVGGPAGAIAGVVWGM